MPRQRLDHAQRQAVDEQHHVRPAGVSVLGDAELVYRQPVVVVWFLAVHDLILSPDHPDLGVPVLDLNAVHEHPVEASNARFQRRALGPRKLAEGVVQRIR